MDSSTLLRAHYRFQQGCFVSDQAEVAGGIFAFSDITPVPMWNHSAWFQGNQDFAKFIESSRAWQSGKNRCPVVYIAEPTPQQLAVLQEQGFEKFDEEAWMTCEAGSFPGRESDEAIEVKDQQALNQFVDTFSKSFQIKEAGYRRALVQREAPGAVRSRHFVLYNEGRAVSVGTVVADGETACLYNIGTPPDQRNKGYGGRVLEHIAAAAIEDGCRVLFLQVENDSNAKRLYEKKGFRTAFVRVGFRLSGWQTNRVRRTKLSNLLGYRASETHVPQYFREKRALGMDVAMTLRKWSGEQGVEKGCVAAWAYLLHRYTGEDTSTFTVCDHANESRKGTSVTIDRFATVQTWISKLPQTDPQSEEEAVETFLCLNGKGTPIHLDDHQYPLEVHVLEEAETVELIFRSDLFSKDSIRRMGAHFTTILQYIARNPKASVADIELLSPSERRQLLVDWNETTFEPMQQSLVHLFEAQVEKTPEAIALAFAKAGEPKPAEELTYRQLNRRANRLAHRLQEMGVGPDVFVGVCLDRSLDMIIALLAILKAGGACVPLDPAYPQERIRFMLQDTSAQVILT
ncbi:MAG TPA: GNAT family N-acetyltransferase, partial [Candidatus Kapabacteria bacterium]|nr:GNAT family N-acetyltransferase [Candidatus Kapabacteria bacterium]